MRFRLILIVGLAWSTAAQAQSADGEWLVPGQPMRKLVPVLTQQEARSTALNVSPGTRIIWPKSASAVQQVREEATAALDTRSIAPHGTAVHPIGVPAARVPATRPKGLSSRLTPQMQQTVLRAADRFGVDAYLIKAVIHAESAFNPQAVSHKNAIGLMQVLPGTAREMGLHEQGQMSVEQLLKDPRVSIVVGTRYLSEQLRHFGTVELALAAYNAGPGAVKRSGNRVPNYAETRAYIERVKQLQGTYSRARSLEIPLESLARGVGS